MAIPVHKQFAVHIAAGTQNSNQTVSVPAGKTMTITHVSGRLSVPAAQVAHVSVQTAALQIDVANSTTTANHYFPTVTESDGHVVFGQSTNIATSGGQIVVSVARLGSASAGTIDGWITIAGQLLP
jgi:hypothetical protein